MATFSVDTTKDEQDAICAAIWKLKDAPIMPMSKLAEVSGVGKNRVRYVITDLLNKGRIKQVLVKEFNERYKRYRYEVL